MRLGEKKCSIKLGQKTKIILTLSFRWLEVRPGVLHKDFPSLSMNHMTLLPEVILKVDFHDETVFASNLFTVSIDIVETGRRNFQKDLTLSINSESLNVSTRTSGINQESYSKWPDYYYSASEKWVNRRDYHGNLSKPPETTRFLQLDLSCKFDFKFVGEFAKNVADAIERLR